MLFLIFSNHHLFGLGFKTSSQCVFLLKDMIVDYVFFFWVACLYKGIFLKTQPWEFLSLNDHTFTAFTLPLWLVNPIQEIRVSFSSLSRKTNDSYKPWFITPAIPEGGGGILGAIWTGRPRQNWPQLKWVPWRCQRFGARKWWSYPIQVWGLGLGAQLFQLLWLLAGGRWLPASGKFKTHTEFWCLTFTACETRQNCFVTKKPVRCVFLCFKIEHFCFPHSRGFGLSEESSDLFEQSRASVVSSGTLSKCVKLRCIEKLLNYGWPTPRFTVGRFFTSFWWRGILLY